MEQSTLDLIKQLGDRHLRPDLEAKIGRVDLNAIRIVRITARHEIAATRQGQLMVWTLANLLARQYGIVREIELNISDATLCSNLVPFGATHNLRSTLYRTIQLIAGSTVNVNDSVEPSRIVDAEIIVGFSSNIGAANFHVSIVADGWNFFIGNPQYAPNIVPTENNPFGTIFAACVAAGEVFKHLHEMKRDAGHFAERLFISLWDYQEYPRWSELPKGKWSSLELPHFYLIGTGAVGQALVFALSSSPDMQGKTTLIDGETIDDKNLNRYLLATQADVGIRKVDLCAQLLQNRSFEVRTDARNWPSYLEPFSSARFDLLSELESQYKYERIISCVDKNPARHAIQNHYPKYLIGGSTFNLGLKVSNYDMRSEYECLKCSNPLDKNSETIEQWTQKLHSLSEEELAAKIQQVSAEKGLVEQFLQNPQCGTVGEQEMRKFLGSDSNPDWAVGFVSVASGTLLAAQFVKMYSSPEGAFPTSQGNSLNFSFLNPAAPRWSKHKRREDCECQTVGMKAWHSNWD